MTPRSEPLAAARVVACLVYLVGCRSPAGPTDPEPPVLPMPELPSLEPEPEPEPVDLSPDPLPSGVVAEVDGQPILEEELRLMVEAAGDEEATPDARNAALLQLVERRLLEANADRLGILVSDSEIDGAIDQVASGNGLTREQLEAAVLETGMSWEGYRKEVTAQIVEMKALRVLGIFDAGMDAEQVSQRRERLVGCLRARSEVQVDDESLALPDNPYGLRTEIGELRLHGELGLPEAELQEAAMTAAKTRMHLCDALSTAELALQELFMERGYLEATVRMPWPEEAVLPATVVAQVSAGRLHLIGEVRFDQSALPRKKRLPEAELRRRVALFLTKGEVARISAMQEASREVSGEFSRMGLGEVEAEVKRKDVKDGVRVDVVYRVTDSE